MADSIFSAPFYVEIPPLTVAKDRVISTNPEEEVIARLKHWAQDKGVDLTTARTFGFDVPVSNEEKARGIRGYEYWLQVPDSFVTPSSPVIPAQAGTHAVLVEPFAGGKFIALRITDPFADPFDRIPQGWQTLVKYIQSNNNQSDTCVIPSQDGVHNPQKNWMVQKSTRNVQASAGMTNNGNWCTPGSCLEEVKTIDGGCCMDVLIILT